MAWESALSKNVSTRRGGGMGSFPDRLTISVSSNKSGEDVKNLSMVISIPVILLKKVRWVIVGRVELLKDSNKDIFLLKRSAKGYMLYGRSSHA